MLINAWMTGTIVEFTDDEGNYTEEHGWVDPTWNRHDVFPSRNDVRPVATYDTNNAYDTEDYPTVNDFIRATLSDELGAWEDGGSGVYYGTDEVMTDQSLRDGKSYTYAIHFTTKGYDGRRGWYEDTITLTD